MNFVFCGMLKFLIYLNWRPAGNSRFQLGAQYKGNCLAFRHIGGWAKDNRVQ